MLLSNTLLSYQTSINHTRFINIHIKLSKKRRERGYIYRNVCVCVWIYHIELKTHARSERKILIGFFYVSYETAGNFCFCHPVNTHTQR